MFLWRNVLKSRAVRELEFRLKEQDSLIIEKNLEISELKEENIVLKENVYKIQKEKEQQLLDISKMLLSKILKEDIIKLYDKVKKFDYIPGEKRPGWVEVEESNGFIEATIVANKTNIDLYSFYSYEDNLGILDSLDGYELVSWYEKAAFGEFEYSQVASCYEKGICVSDYKTNKKYKEYRKSVEYEVVLKLIEKKPLEVLKVLIEFFNQDKKEELAYD